MPGVYIMLNNCRAVFIIYCILFITLLSVDNSAASMHPDSDSRSADTRAQAKSSLVAALMLLDLQKHDEAIAPLRDALDGLPQIGDYILIRLAESYAATEQYELSTEAANSLLSRYPRSPVRKKAQKRKRLNAIKVASVDPLNSYSAYLMRYPWDDEIRMQYARLLQQDGFMDKADRELAKIFAHAGINAVDAYGMMSKKDLPDNKWLARAKNLMQQRNYSEAEKIIRKLLATQSNNSLKKMLARCLFKQRKYSLSAPIYLETGDLYNAARSQIRMGDTEGFQYVANKMLKERDPKTPKLLIAYSNDLRRDGKKGEAMETLKRVIRAFPRDEEDALWSLGWLYYSTGKYIEALDKFTRLSERYNKEEYESSKYRYWKARAMERVGEDASEIYEQITGVGYYPSLASIRTGIKPDLSFMQPGDLASSLDLTRADLLLDVGMTEEAVQELSLLSKKRLDDSATLAVAYRLKSARKYREAMLLVLRLPEEKRYDDILYPLAYWDEVSGISQKYTVDPLLILSLMREESRFDSNALSPVGAMGLMQLMPETARATARRVKLSLNGNHSIYDIENNILLGTYYLKGLLREFKSIPVSLAAYNAGEGRVRRWLKEGDYQNFDEFVEDIPFKETRGYVKRIMRSLFMYKAYQEYHAINISTKGL